MGKDAQTSKSQTMDLVTAIVRRSLAQRALDAALKAGAPGITFFSARGTGVKENLGFVGTLIESEKEVLWVVTDRSETSRVLDAIVTAANLNLPGEGFAYVQPISEAVGFLKAK